jgi:uncharacterized membrane protein YqaE (UPF0057 family)
MTLGKMLWCIFLPPVAVLDRGLGSVLLVFVLWLCGWIPGTIAAWVISSRPSRDTQAIIQAINDKG